MSPSAGYPSERDRRGACATEGRHKVSQGQGRAVRPQTPLWLSPRQATPVTRTVGIAKSSQKKSRFSCHRSLEPAAHTIFPTTQEDGGRGPRSRSKNESNSLYFRSRSYVPGRGSGHLTCITAFTPLNFGYRCHSYFTDEEIEAQEGEGQTAERDQHHRSQPGHTDLRTTRKTRWGSGMGGGGGGAKAKATRRRGPPFRSRPARLSCGLNSGPHHKD